MSAFGFPYIGKENYGKQPLPRCVRRSNNSEDHDQIDLHYLGMNNQSSSIQLRFDGSCSSSSTLSRKTSGSMKEDYRKRLDCNCKGTRRASLDMSTFIRSNKNSPFGGQMFMENKETTVQDKKKKKKKHIKPSSPGGRLASFFNSIVSLQTFSKRKKDKSSKSRNNSVQEGEVEDSPASSWRTRIKTRRSSFGYFTSTTTAAAATTRTKTTTITRTAHTSASTAGPGFWTPPPYNVGNAKLPNSTPKTEVPHGSDIDWLNEKFNRFHGSSQNFHYTQHATDWVNRHLSEDDVEEAESDSSSDLFELNLNLNYDCDYNNNNRFGYCSSDLPVYESTHLNSIKKK